VLFVLLVSKKLLPPWRWDVDQRAEEAMFFVTWSSRKEERVRRAVGTVAMTELKRPKTVDLNGLSCCGM